MAEVVTRTDPNVDDLVALAELEQEALVWAPSWDHSRACLVTTVGELARRVSQLRVADVARSNEHFGGLELQLPGGPWAQTLRREEGWWIEVHPHAWDGTQDAFLYEEVLLPTPEAVAKLMWQWVHRQMLEGATELEPVVHPTTRPELE